jgi:hypothetical protein
MASVVLLYSVLKRLVTGKPKEIKCSIFYGEEILELSLKFASLIIIK